MEKVISENVGLVKYWVNHYACLCRRRGDIAPDDLLQAGRLGVMEAADTFNPDAGAWSSWASLYIRKNMRNALGLSKGTYTVFLPDGTQERRRYVVTSLNAPVYDADDIELVEVVAEENPVDIDARIILEADAERVQAALNALESPEVRQAIRERYIDGKAYKAIADDMHLEVRQAQKLVREGMRSLLADKRIKTIYRERRNMRVPESWYASGNNAAPTTKPVEKTADAIMHQHKATRKKRTADPLSALIREWKQLCK